MSAKAAWWLERIAADGSALAVPVQALPFGIGRDEDNGLVLVASGVSRRHATPGRWIPAAAGCVLFDLGSTNGSFVNRAKVEAPRAARRGRHRPHRQRRVPDPPRRRPRQHPAGRGAHRRRRRSARRSASSSSPTSRSSSPCSAARACRRRCSRSSTPATAGSSPTSCSAAASIPGCRPRRCTCSAWRRRLGRAAELSLALRNHGVAAVASQLRGATLFVNAHPTETVAARLRARHRRGWCASIPASSW